MKFYGFLTNGATSALIDAEGRVDWLPMPRFDSPAVFARLLGGQENGSYAISPTQPVTKRQQEYVQGTNILRTTLETAGGRVEITDYLVVGRPELRRIVDNDVPVAVRLNPAFGYGLVASAVAEIPGGAVFENPLGGEMLAFVIMPEDRAAPAMSADPVRGHWVLEPGKYQLVLRHIGDGDREGSLSVDALLAEARGAADALDVEVRRRSFERNVFHWRQIRRPDYDGPYREAVERSLLVLHGLVYRTTGAIIAAPTTSLPETVGESRQWDYRFSWIRDGSYTAEAFLAVGDVIPARRFLDFLLNCVDLQGKPFQAPFFHVDGTLIRGEQELGWLRGFRDSRPCREGNAATLQTQMDVEGDFLWTVYRYVDATGDTVFLEKYWEVLRVLITWVKENWRAKDASLWEFRGQDDHYTHSKLMCWVALHYGADLAGRLGIQGDAEAWGREAEAIRDEIWEKARDPETGIFVQAYGSRRLDAALLLMPLYGFVKADDEVFAKTLAAIRERLVKGHWVFRYESDMLGKAAHPFVLATSWLARVHILRHEMAEATTLLEGLLASRTELGLLGEHADMRTGEPRGNFPQAFSHLGIIMTALELAEGGPWEVPRR